MFLIDFHAKAGNSQNFHAHLCKVKKIIATFAKNNNEMTAEREIAGFVLPFVAGAAIASSFTDISAGSFPYISTVSAVMTALSLPVLLHPAHKRLRSGSLWVLIATVALSCGMICHTTDTWSSISDPDIPGITGRMAETMGLNLKNAIYALPYKNDQTNAIVSALIIGDRTHLSADTIEAFRISGASHILALSGMHLGIIYGVLKLILTCLGNSYAPKAVKSIITIFFCGFYTLATGAGPSIVRAFLFILIGECAALVGRPRNLTDVLLSSLLIQIIISPGSVRNIGFQLSYAAIAGIAFIYPHLKRMWPENEGSPVTRILRWVWNSAAISIACQITTGPLAYIYFGSFPKYFILTNLLALPLTTLIIPVCLLTLLLESCGICPEILLYASEWLITTLTESLRTIASF